MSICYGQDLKNKTLHTNFLMLDALKCLEGFGSELAIDQANYLK